MAEHLEQHVAALAAAIKETEAYKGWQAAREDLEQRHAAKVMLRDLQTLQAQLMQKLEAGQALSEQEEQRWQQTLQTVAHNPYVAAMLQAEAALAQVLGAVNETLARQLGMDGEQTDAPEAETAESPLIRPDTAGGGLWVPGDS